MWAYRCVFVFSLVVRSSYVVDLCWGVSPLFELCKSTPTTNQNEAYCLLDIVYKASSQPTLHSLPPSSISIFCLQVHVNEIVTMIYQYVNIIREQGLQVRPEKWEQCVRTACTNLFYKAHTSWYIRDQLVLSRPLRLLLLLLRTPFFIPPPPLHLPPVPPTTIKEWIYLEWKRLWDLSFRFASKPEPMWYVSNLAGSLHTLPPDLSVAGNRLILEYNTDIVREILSGMVPSNMLLVVVDKELKGTTNQVRHSPESLTNVFSIIFCPTLSSRIPPPLPRPTYTHYTHICKKNKEALGQMQFATY